IPGDGVHEFEYWAVDNAGNESNIGTDTIVMDTINPGVNITRIDGALPGAKIINGIVQVDITVTDVTPIVGTPGISIDGASFADITTWWPLVDTGTYTLDTTGLSDGIHTLQVRAIDEAGNVGYSSVRSIEIDNTLTGVVILVPATDAHISGTNTIRVISPPATYEVLIQVHKNVGSVTSWFNPAVRPISPGSTYTDTVSQDGWSASWATRLFTDEAGLGDGTYTVRAIAYGTGGTLLGSSTNTNIEIDNSINVPVMPAITTPTRGMLSGTISVDADVTEAAFEYALSGGEYYTIGVDTKPPFSYSWNTYSILDGTYTIRVMAKDEVGNVASSTTNAFKVDNTSPTADITLVDGSLPGAKVVSGSVSVVFVDDDAATSVATRSISIDGGTFAIASSPYTWDTTLLPDGAHTLQIQVTDAVGNVGYSSLRTIEVNNTQAGVVI
ncbi:MAG: Ig-like domain-containing protein, partial [Candidatus Desantisbacteria bacterium]